jgi:hypothetical protein
MKTTRTVLLSSAFLLGCGGDVFVAGAGAGDATPELGRAADAGAEELADGGSAADVASDESASADRDERDAAAAHDSAAAADVAAGDAFTGALCCSCPGGPVHCAQAEWFCGGVTDCHATSCALGTRCTFQSCTGVVIDCP